MVQQRSGQICHHVEKCHSKLVYLSSVHLVFWWVCVCVQACMCMGVCVASLFYLHTTVCVLL